MLKIVKMHREKSQIHTENARKTIHFSKNPVPESRKNTRNREFRRKSRKSNAENPNGIARTRQNRIQK